MFRTSHQLGVIWSKVRFTPAALEQGMLVEREHKDATHCDPLMTARIALAHLREDPLYYRKLSRMERGLCK